MVRNNLIFLAIAVPCLVISWFSAAIAIIGVAIGAVVPACGPCVCFRPPNDPGVARLVNLMRWSCWRLSLIHI